MNPTNNRLAWQDQATAEPDNDWLAWLAEPETDDGSYTLNGRHESFTRKQIKHARAVLERIVVPGNQKES